MRHKLVSIFASLIVLLNIVLLNLAIAGVAQAQPLMQFSFPSFRGVKLTEQQQNIVQQLESDVLPKLESILTAEQRDRFKSSLSTGGSVRKAFKSMNLSPEQKTQLALLFKSLPKKDIFSSLTPEQKKQLFAKKKEMFKSSSS